MLLVSLRWLGTALLLLLFANKQMLRDCGQLRCNLRALFVMGAIGLAPFNALLYAAAHTTSSLNIGIVQGAIPVFVLIGAFVIYRTPASLLQMIGVVLTLIGVCIVASAGSFERLTALIITRGDFFMIMACVLYAGYTLALRRFSALSSLSLFSVIAFSAFITSIPLSAVEFLSGNLQWPTTKGWVIVTLVTLLPSFLGQIFFIQGVTAIGPGRAGIFANLIPVFASILAIVILNEPFKLYHGIALTLVLGGIWLSERHQPSNNVS